MRERGDGADDGAGIALDVLLDAVEAVPAGEMAWDLDLLRTALRIARATEAPEDLRRAGLAYGALGGDSRARLAGRIAEATRRGRRVAGRPSPAESRAEPRSGLAGLVAGLIRRRDAERGAATARARLLRDMPGGT
ncbi:hypothetical protein [Azospirillum halopraeferens]|uniref:hypothetical protein n=1 Tax=Azospirillum halopraeferens TaxID=34010 RepID=UPI00041FB674|nr:hypothetical protein [Azospirillum halopraeferens]